MANEINIGGIKIVFGADTKPLEDGGRRVEQTLDRAEVAANGLKMALGWMAGFAGFAALGSQIGQAVGRLENMAKLSRQVDQALAGLQKLEIPADRTASGWSLKDPWGIGLTLAT